MRLALRNGWLSLATATVELTAAAAWLPNERARLLYAPAPSSCPYSPKCLEKVDSAKFISTILHSPVLWASRARLAPVEHATLSATSYGAVRTCTRVHGAAAFRACELLVENYGKHLVTSNRSTPLSENRARNLSSSVFVVWQQYGRNGGDTGNGLERRPDTVG